MLLMKLGWMEMEDGDVALVFDMAAWALFEAAADKDGVNPREMIVERLLGLLGGVRRGGK